MSGVDQGASTQAPNVGGTDRWSSSRLVRQPECVANGASIPEAKLNKKHLGVCYHAVREASAAKIWQVGFIKGEFNVADCLTMILSGTQLDKHILASGCTGNSG